MDSLKALLDIGVPPTKIAAHLGVSRVAVHYWKTGAARPSQGHALKLAQLVAEMRARLNPEGLHLTAR